MSLRIDIRTIPQSEQRYDTLGDYWQDADGVFQIRITEMTDWRHEFLIVMHELAESFLCLNRGIPEPEIMAFDIAWAEVNTDPQAEPGNDPAAPYHREHRFAEDVIERPMAAALGVDWVEYEFGCSALCEAMGRVT